MKQLQDLPDHDIIAELFFPGSPQQVSVFNRKVLNAKFLPETSENGELARIDGDNYHDSNFERAFMFFKDRCPTWPEMVELKDFFWHPNNVVFQVHPRKEEYVNRNKTALHLWRTKDAQSFRDLHKVPFLIQHTMAILQREPSTSELYFKEGRIFGKRFVAIFGGKEWPAWEQVCSIKRHCFGEDHTALQFNVCRELDLNHKHILLLWDADEFKIALPPKEIV